MAETGATKGKRKSLSKSQLETELGAELLSLCQAVSADGRLTTGEVTELKTWLDSHSSDELPAIAHLRTTIEQIVADGKISDGELTEVYRALETVLPVEFRKEARTARRAYERAERERNDPIAKADFMVAGVRYEGRPSLIQRYVREEDPAFLRREKDNPHSKYAIAVLTKTGHHIGYMPNEEARGWAPEMDAGAPVRAFFKVVLDGGRYPIPVVIARLYRAEAALDPEPVPSSGESAWPIWVVLIVAAVALVKCLGS